MIGAADIRAVMGSSGSGKSAYVKQELRRLAPARLLIFDPMDEYGDFARAVPSMRTLARMTAKARAAGFAFRWIPKGDNAARVMQFRALAKLAFAVGDVTFTVEELQTVTQPTYAPPEWSDCTLRGRHRRLRIFGIAQRPAGVDKNFFGNATLIRCGRLNFADDVTTMARVLDVPPDDIRTMPELAFIERNTRTGQITRGVLAFEAKIKAARGQKTPRLRL